MAASTFQTICQVCDITVKAQHIPGQKSGKESVHVWPRISPSLATSLTIHWPKTVPIWPKLWPGLSAHLAKVSGQNPPDRQQTAATSRDYVTDWLACRCTGDIIRFDHLIKKHTQH